MTLGATVEVSASWASFLTPARRFQLLLLYHVFPEIRRLVKDNYAYDDHCEQDQGEEDHEEDIGGVGEGWGSGSPGPIPLGSESSCQSEC